MREHDVDASDAVQISRDDFIKQDNMLLLAKRNSQNMPKYLKIPIIL